MKKNCAEIGFEKYMVDLRWVVKIVYANDSRHALVDTSSSMVSYRQERSAGKENV